jgi:hypothetical protein
MKMFEIIERAIANFDSLPEEDKERFAGMCAILAACITEHQKAVWLIDRDDTVSVMAVNANELEIAQLIGEGYELLNCAVMEDAPPKEMMN